MPGAGLPEAGWGGGPLRPAPALRPPNLITRAPARPSTLRLCTSSRQPVPLLRPRDRRPQQLVLLVGVPLRLDPVELLNLGGVFALQGQAAQLSRVVQEHAP